MTPTHDATARLSADLVALLSNTNTEATAGHIPDAGSGGHPKIAFKLEEAFAKISVGRTTGFRLIREGKLRTVRIGSRRLVLARDLVQFAESLTDQVETGQPLAEEFPQDGER